jgi:thymidylate kinase
MIAYERRSLLRRLDRLRARGAIIISDRYPSLDAGTMDSAQLSTIEAPTHSILRYLANLESKMYRDMPRPSIVMKLSVPIDVAISRNLSRVKPGKETERYLRERHKQPSQRSYGAMAEFSIDTSPPLEETLKAVKTKIWQYLSVNCRQKTEHPASTLVSNAKSRGASS